MDTFYKIIRVLFKKVLWDATWKWAWKFYDSFIRKSVKLNLYDKNSLLVN